MPDSDIAITAGSGTKVDTRTVGAGSDEHRQVVCVGDPVTAGNVGGVDAFGAQAVNPNVALLSTYAVALSRIASGALTANTAKAMLSLEHAASATKTVKVRRIVLHGYATTAVAGTVEFQLHRGTAASSAGTAIVPVPLVPGTAAAEVVAKSLPTITAATLVLAGVGGNVPATANSAIPQLLLCDWKASGLEQPLTLRAGNLDSLVLSVISTAAINVTLSAYVLLTEE